MYSKGAAMPRRARMYLPGHPCHIVQRGNHREACFVEPENYRYYLELWKENARRYGVHGELILTLLREADIALGSESANGNYSMWFAF